MNGDTSRAVGHEADPVAEDDFPEFAAPPRHKPSPEQLQAESASPQDDDGTQGQVDDVLERLRRERAEGKR